MAISINASLRNARAQLLIDAMDAGGAGGSIKFYDGVRPATGGLVTGILATLVLSYPSASVTAGVITFNAVNDDVSADADGTITWCRVTDSSGVFVMDLSCGLAGSGADVIFNTVITKVGGAVQVIPTSTITEGAA